MAILGALGDLVLALSADTAKFQSDLGRAQRVADKFGKEVGKTLGNLAGMIGLVFSGRAIKGWIDGQIDAADAAGKMAQKVGVSTEALSAYMVAARLSDVSNEQLQTGFQQLAKNQADFVNGSGEAGDAFRALGISQEDVKRLNGDNAALFDLVAGKLATFADGANKTAIAMKIFGRSGAELIPLINGLEEARKEAELLGALIDKDTAAAAERFNDNLTRVGVSVQAVGLNIAKAVLPTLEKMSERLVQAAKDTQGMANAGRIADTGLKMLATAGTIIATTFKVAGQTVGAVAAALVLASKGEMREAWITLTQGGFDMAKEVSGAIESISTTWDATARDIKAKSPETGKKIAAPALVAADATKRAATDMKAAIMAAHDDALAWAEAGIEAQKALEKAVGETLDRDDAEMITEAPLLEDAAEQIYDIEKATDKAAKKAESFNFTFDSALENVIVKGGEARDVVDALIADLSRMVTRQLVTEPLGRAVSGALAGFSFGDLFSQPSFGLSSALEGMPAFAEGTDFVPRTGPALVHRGEKVVTAEENARNGGGRQTIIFNISTPDVGSFRAAQGQISADMAAALRASRRNS